MFWGAFSYDSRTSMWAMHGDPESPRSNINATRIFECLQEQLPTICSPGSIFAQDNAPTHTAILVQRWLRNWAQENGIELVDWPPYSPDFNPIENVWKLLKEGICTRYPELGDLPKNEESKRQLIRATIECWEIMRDDIFENLVSSMERRLQAVIAVRGWYTKY